MRQIAYQNNHEYLVHTYLQEKYPVDVKFCPKLPKKLVKKIAENLKIRQSLCVSKKKKIKKMLSLMLTKAIKTSVAAITTTTTTSKSSTSSTSSTTTIGI